MATALMALAVPASADLVLIGTDLDDGGNSNGATEEGIVLAQTGITVMMDFRCNFGDGGDGCPNGDGAVSTGSYSVGAFYDDPAMSDISWDLTGTGYLLYAVIAKTSGSLNLYEVTGDPMQLVGSGTILSPIGKDSISHISFFVVRGTTTFPEPGTLALLGLGLIGMGAARRRKVV